MRKVDNDMKKAISTDFDIDIAFGVPIFAMPAGQSIDATTTLARVISRIQWSANEVTVKNLGAV